jgi:ABC-2 type transport system permease protein
MGLTMNKTWLVLKNELITVIRRRSFILTLILLPLAGFIIMLVVSGLSKNATATGQKDPVSEMFMPSANQALEGYVDLSGVIKQVPETDANHLKAFSDEISAKQALGRNEITAYYIIPANYLKTGEVIYVRPDFNPLGAVNQTDAITNTLNYNLVGYNQDLVYRLQNPMSVTDRYLSSQPQRDPNNALTFMLPYIVTFMFYMLILSSASLMLSSVATEKENRVMEVMMTSVTPTQMLTGKIVALGLAGLLQTIVWSGAGLLMLRLSGSMFEVPVTFQIPSSVLIWGVIFFILGFAFYGSLMGGVGALVPNLREASQATTIIVIPLLIPLMLISVLANDPNGALAVFLSLFPLTAPVAMMARLSATIVPLWQIGLAVLLLAATVVFTVRSSASAFRAQNLLSGQAFSLKLFFRVLLGKA